MANKLKMSNFVRITNRLGHGSVVSRRALVSRGRNCTVAAACLLITIAGGCKKNAPNQLPNSATPAASPSSPKPAATPAAKPTASPSPPPRVSSLSGGLEDGWLAIGKVSDKQKTAWAEGRVEEGEKLTIDTENVERFQLDLSRVKLNWDKRIVLRIDGFNRELTRKNYPILDYRRTTTGGWRLVDQEP